MSKMEDVMTALKGIGITEHDAVVIADCVVTRKSCTWMNADHVDEKILKDLGDLIRQNSYGLTVSVQPVPTRGKYIWEVKVH